MTPWKEVGRYGSVGLEFVLTILILGGLGNWLDGRYWGGHGWGTGIGFLLGVAVAFRNLIRTANQMQRDIERAEAKDPRGSRWTVDESWVHPPDEARDEAGGATDVARSSDPEHTSAGASEAEAQERKTRDGKNGSRS
jgi:hypothetical protein